jgi:hypothetical protein
MPISLPVLISVVQNSCFGAAAVVGMVVGGVVVGGGGGAGASAAAALLRPAGTTANTVAACRRARRLISVFKLSDLLIVWLHPCCEKKVDEFEEANERPPT